MDNKLFFYFKTDKNEKINTFLENLLKCESYKKLLFYSNIAREFIKDDPMGYIYGAIGMCHCGLYTSAEELILMATQRFPKNLKVYYHYATLPQLYGQKEESLKRWNSICEIFPKNSMGYINSAKILFEKKAYNEAKDILQKGISLAPHLSILSVKFAETIEKSQDKKATNNIWENLLLQYPNDLIININALGYYIRQNDNKKICKLLNKLKEFSSTTQNKTEIYNIFFECIKYNYINKVKTNKIIFDVFFLEKISFGKIPVICMKIIHFSEAEKNFLNYIKKELEWVKKDNNYITNMILSCVYDEIRYEDIEKYIQSIELRDLFLFFNNKNINNNKSFTCYVKELILNKKIKEYTDISLYKILLILSCIDKNIFYQLINIIYHELQITHSQLENIINKNILRYSYYPNKKIKIALCVSGQLRGYKEAKKSWNKLNLSSYECDTYVHIWKNMGNKFPFPWHADRWFSGNFLNTYKKMCIKFGMDQMTYRFPSLFHLFTQNIEVKHSEVQEVYQTDNIVIEDDQDERFRFFSNQKKMYYKINKCFDLIQKTKYDIVIRIRPDLCFDNDIDIEWMCYKLFNERLIYTDSEPKLYPIGYRVGDQLAIGRYELMSVYSNIYNHIKSDDIGCYGFKGYSRPHEPLAYVLFNNGINVERVNGLKKISLLPTKPIDIDIIYKAIQKDIEKRENDALDNELINACLNDLKNIH